MLGIRTRGGRMEGANESTELRRHPEVQILRTAVIECSTATKTCGKANPVHEQF